MVFSEDLQKKEHQFILKVSDYGEMVPRITAISRTCWKWLPSTRMCSNTACSASSNSGEYVFACHIALVASMLGVNTGEQSCWRSDWRVSGRSQWRFPPNFLSGADVLTQAQVVVPGAYQTAVANHVYGAALVLIDMSLVDSCPGGGHLRGHSITPI